MIKKSGILTVSLIAMVAALPARADIASTTYVNDKIQPVETKIDNHITNKLAIDTDQGSTLDGDQTGSKTLYPSMSTVTAMLNNNSGELTSAIGMKVDKQQGSTNANKAMITNAGGQVVPGQIATGMIADKAVTNDKLSDAVNTSLGLANSAVQPAAISDMETQTHASGTYATQTALGTTNSNVSNLTTRVGTAETAINTLNGDANTAGSVAKQIVDAIEAASDDYVPVTDADAPKSLVARDASGVARSFVYNDDDFFTMSSKDRVTGKTSYSIYVSKSSNVVANDKNAVTGSAVYNALSNKQDKQIATTNDAGKAVVVGSDGKMTISANTLGTAAYQNTTDTYSPTGTVPVSGTAVASAISGITATANSALQTVTANNNAGVVTGISANGTAIEMTKAKVTGADIADNAAIAKTQLASGVQTSLGYADAYHTASATYGDIITHDASEFATSSQGAKADTALQPDDVKDTYTANSEDPISGKGVAEAISNLDLGNTYQAKSDSNVTGTTNYLTAGNGVANNLKALDTKLKAVENTANAAVKSVTKSGSGNILSDITTSNGAVTVSVSGTAIPKPSGNCTDCVLHFNGTEYSWEEVGR